MADNTDERGEDAMARQRGGSERPQHVDTCRVYNCYGCEEIVDEPGHLPECLPVLREMTGEWVDEDTGEAECCICSALRACEARVFVERTDHWNAALDAARNAVEHFHRGSCRWYYAERRCTCGLNESIDALRGESNV